MKEEINARAAGLPTLTSSTFSNDNTAINATKDTENSSNNIMLANNTLITRNNSDLSNNSNESFLNENTCIQITNTQEAISLSTVYVSNTF